MSVAVAAVIWLAAGYRLLILRRHPHFLNTMYCLIFVVVAAAFTVKVLEPQIDSLAGPYVGDLDQAPPRGRHGRVDRAVHPRR